MGAPQRSVMSHFQMQLFVLRGGSIWNGEQCCISILRTEPPSISASFLRFKAPRIHLSMLSRHLEISNPI